MKTEPEQIEGHTRERGLSPEYRRNPKWKNLPGALGKAYNFCRARDVSRDPFFVYLRGPCGRKRAFRPERRGLMNAFYQCCISRCDIATGMLDLTLEQVAEELGVSASRVYRLVNEVMIPFGLMEVHVDQMNLEETKRGGLVWDRYHNCWFPKTVALTPRFWAVAGVKPEEIERQSEVQRNLRSQGLSEFGETLSLREARNRKRRDIFRKSWELRQSRASKQKRRLKMAEMTLDERKEIVANELIRTHGAQMETIGPEQFEKEVWRELNLLGLGLPLEKSPPH